MMTLKATMAWIALSVSLTGAIIVTSPVSAETDPIYTGFISNVAVQGYDPVAYFKQGAPVKGSDSFATTYKGAVFHFANAKNLKEFETSPAKYAPQYGGYCAWAVAQGYTAKGDAQYWKIVDGKLYLNYSQDIKTRWEKDIDGFIESANKQWPKILAQ